MGNFETRGLLIFVSSLGDNVQVLFQGVVPAFLEGPTKALSPSLYVCRYVGR